MAEPDPGKEPDPTPTATNDELRNSLTNTGSQLLSEGLPPGRAFLDSLDQLTQREEKQAIELMISIDRRLIALEDETRKLMWRYGL